MINDESLLRSWLKLECISIEENTLVRSGGETCDDVEYILVARFFDHDAWYWRADLILTGSLLPNAFDHIAETRAMIEDRLGLVVSEIRQETSYSFITAPEIRTPDVQALGDTAETLDTFAVVRDGAIVSRAWSVRRNADAAEIAVETREGYRRQGYGRQVVAAWAQAILRQGKIGIYSHRKGNLESRALAQSAQAVQFVEVVSYHQ